MQNIKLSYEATGTKNYLQVAVSEKISKYQLKMLENNQIPGFLSVNSRVLNGTYILDYDITGMIRVKDLLERGKWTDRTAKELLYNILKVMAGTEEYLLTYKQCVLNKDYLYCTEDGKIGMLYLPLKEQETASPKQIRAFYQDILVNYLTAGRNPYFLELMRYIFTQDFSVAGLTKRLKDEVEGNEEPTQTREVYADVQSAVQPGSGQIITPPQKESAEKSLFTFAKQEKKAEESKEKKVNVPMPEVNPWGIAVPGGTAAEAVLPAKKEEKSGLFGKRKDAEKKETKKENKKEKGGLFSHKKKEEVPGFGVPVKAAQVAQPEQNTLEESGGNQVWKGTVMITNESMEDSKTVVLGADHASAYLRHKGESIPMQYFPFSIGKENTDYVIHKNVISRMHAKIKQENGKYFISDENSSNHTYVNGKQIAPYTNVPLSHGDRLRLADEEMTFLVESGE